MAIDPEAAYDVLALRDMLALCPSWIAIAANPTGDQYTQVDEKTATKPLAVVYGVDHGVTRLGAGFGVESGTMVIRFVLSGLSADASEAFGRNICAELRNLETGLPNVTAATGEVEVSSETETASGEDLTYITIEVTYGLE